MDFIDDDDDTLNFYPDWYLDPNFDPRILDWDEDLIPPEEINEDNYDVFPALSPSGEPSNIKLYVPKESKIYTPFKSLEQLEKDVKELNKDQNK